MLVETIIGICRTNKSASLVLKELGYSGYGYQSLNKKKDEHISLKDLFFRVRNTNMEEASPELLSFVKQLNAFYEEAVMVSKDMSKIISPAREGLESLDDGLDVSTVIDSDFADPDDLDNMLGGLSGDEDLGETDDVSLDDIDSMFADVDDEQPALGGDDSLGDILGDMEVPADKEEELSPLPEKLPPVTKKSALEELMNAASGTSSGTAEKISSDPFDDLKDIDDVFDSDNAEI